MASDGKKGEVSASGYRRQAGMAQQVVGSGSSRPRMTAGVPTTTKLPPRQTTAPVSIMISCEELECHGFMSIERV